MTSNIHTCFFVWTTNGLVAFGWLSCCCFNLFSLLLQVLKKGEEKTVTCLFVNILRKCFNWHLLKPWNINLSPPAPPKLILATMTSGPQRYILHFFFFFFFFCSSVLWWVKVHMPSTFWSRARGWQNKHCEPPAQSGGQGGDSETNNKSGKERAIMMRVTVLPLTFCQQCERSRETIFTLNNLIWSFLLFRLHVKVVWTPKVLYSKPDNKKVVEGLSYECSSSWWKPGFLFAFQSSLGLLHSFHLISASL